jgi:repressor LexA
MAKGLTKRQRAILEYIVSSIRDESMPPTIAEIGVAFSIRSTNGVNDHLEALERKGYIERSSKARGIRITEKAAAGIYQRDVGTLPLLGRVAAGAPLLAEENIEGHIAVSQDLARRNAYCLRINGDSMIDDGILDGDLVVVDQDKRPSKGDIVVALIEDEATVKRFYLDGDTVELRPSHPVMQPMRFPARSVTLQGVVVALQREIS